jgi:hypothetical protein
MHAGFWWINMRVRPRHRWENNINPLMPELNVWFLKVGCIIKAMLGI